MGRDWSKYHNEKTSEEPDQPFPFPQPVKLQEPIWTGIYLGIGFLIASALVGAAVVALLAIVGLVGFGRV